MPLACLFLLQQGLSLLPDSDLQFLKALQEISESSQVRAKNHWPWGSRPPTLWDYFLHGWCRHPDLDVFTSSNSDNWSLHSFCCCLLFPPVANCRSFNPHLPGVDFRPVNCLIIDARVVHNFFSITPPWFPFVIMAWNSKTVTDCLFNKLLVFEHLLSASHLAQLYTGIWEIYTGNRNWLRHVSWAKTKNWVSSGRNSWFNFFFFPVAEKGN